MKKTTFLLSLTMLFMLTGTSDALSQKCSKESSARIETGYPKLKYCMENLGWRESVKKYEWRVTVYNLYTDVKVKMGFTLIEQGTEPRGIGFYVIPANGSRSYSFYFSSPPEFVYENIELIED